MRHIARPSTAGPPYIRRMAGLRYEARRFGTGFLFHASNAEAASSGHRSNRTCDGRGSRGRAFIETCVHHSITADISSEGGACRWLGCAVSCVLLEDYGIAWTYRIIDNYPYRTRTRLFLCRCLIYRIIDIPVYCGTVSPVPVVPVYLLAAAYCFGMRTALAGTEKF